MSKQKKNYNGYYIEPHYIPQKYKISKERHLTSPSSFHWRDKADRIMIDDSCDFDLDRPSL